MMQQSQKRVFSGMRPTGKLHIGHFLGPLQLWLQLQEKYQCFFFVADVHALTSLSPEKMKQIPQNTEEMVLDWLACGINPEKTIIFQQSKVPYHIELSTYLGVITPLSWLLRCPTFKEQARNQPHNVNYGLLGYPVLQTADIILYKAEIVPVGEDQLAHLELARKIVRSFNKKFGKIFPEPHPLLSEFPKVKGLNRPEEKMSKSFGPENYIALSDSPQAIREKIKKAITDTGPNSKNKKMSPGVANLFFLLEAFADKEVVEEFKESYQKGTLKYTHLKEVLAENIIKKLAPIQEKRKEIQKKKNFVKDVLENGNKKANQFAQKTVEEVRKKMGFF